jgi:HEAT repeat protein
MFRNLVSWAALAALVLAGASPLFAQKSSSSKEDEAKLIGVLRSNASRKAKADACRELGRVGTREAVAPLAALLDDEELSHMARYGLEPIPDPAVDAALRDALGKLKGRHLVGVIGSVGVRRDPGAVVALSKHLGDSDADVAQAAARALGKIGTVDAAHALEKALSGGADSTRQAACEGLFRCAEVLRSQGQRKEARAIYEHVGKAQVPDYMRTGATKAAEAIRQR